MAQTRNTFEKAVMNKDLDERLIPKGQYRHAKNISTTSSQGGSVGALEPSLGNTLLINYSLTNGKCIGSIADTSDNLIYYFLTSDLFDMIVEYSPSSNTSVVVLKDTKDRVLKFDSTKLINGINVINTEDPLYKQLAWTDNIAPRKIYIQTAKSFVVDGFDEYDILLIKRPPYKEPSISVFKDTAIKKNRIQNKNLSFAYRYIYEGDEISSFSFYSEVTRVVSDVDIEHIYNSVAITINTGDSRVKEIEILYKEINSIVTYKIVTIHKVNDGVLDNIDYIYNFANDKTYPVISNNDVNLLYNNVPLYAYNQDVVGNRLMYFNYKESYDNVVSDYVITPFYTEWEQPLNISAITYTDPNMFIDFGTTAFVKNSIIRFDIFFTDLVPFEGNTIVDYVVEKNYASITQLFVDMEAKLEEMFSAKGVLSFASLAGTVLSLSKVKLPVGFRNGINKVHIFPPSVLSYKSETSNKFGLVYYDEFNRSSLSVTRDNGIYLDSIQSTNRLGNEVASVIIAINNLAPDWAVKYKIARLTNSYNYGISKAVTIFYFQPTNITINPSGMYISIYDDDVNKYKVGSILELNYQIHPDGTVHSPLSNLRYKIEKVGIKSDLAPDVDDGEDNVMGEVLVYVTAISGHLAGVYAESDVPNYPGLVTWYKNCHFTIINDTKEPLAVYYEIPETYDIINNEHQGGTQNQNYGISQAAIIAPVDGDVYFIDYKQEKYRTTEFFTTSTFENVVNNRPHVVSVKTKENNRFASLTYSEPFTESTAFNGLSTFNLSLANYRDLDKSYGSIQVGKGRYGDIFIAQEDKLSIVLFDKDILSNADGTGNIVSTNNILGQQVYVPIHNGISTDPESFIEYEDFLIMTDASRGEILIVKDGKVDKISARGMDSYIRELMKNNLRAKKIGGYNPDTQEYIISIGGYTLAYSMDYKGWTTFYSYVPDDTVYINGEYYTFKNGVLYKHDNDTLYNNFYGEQYDTVVELVVNENADETKVFKAVNLESDEAWNIVYNTNITSGTIDDSEFEKKEDEWYAYLRRSDATLDTSSMAVQGVGIVTGVNGTTISFPNVSKDISNGDALYRHNVGTDTLILVGTISAHTSASITVASLIGTISINDLAVCVKNSRIEGSEARGYYLNLKLTSTTTSNHKLFAVNVDTSKSFQ